MALALICGPAWADDPAVAGSPLDRLRQRSATTRWQSAKKELQGMEKPALPTPVEPQPTLAPRPSAISPLPIAEDGTRWSTPEVGHGVAPSVVNEIPQPPRLTERLPGATPPRSFAAPPQVTISEPEPISGQAASATPSTKRSVAVPAEGLETLGPTQIQNRSLPIVSGAPDSQPPAQPSPRLLFNSREEGDSILVPPISFSPPDEPASPVAAADRSAQPAIITRLAQVPAAPPEPIQQASAERSGIFRPIAEIAPSRSYTATPVAKIVDTENSIPLADIVPPHLQPLPLRGSTERYFAGINYQWLATNLNHNPLYFEDFALERYGHVYPEAVQPFVSVGKFGIQFLGLPYQLALAHPCNEEYSLGYLQPGDCNPTFMYQVPFDLRAAAIAGGAYTGLIYLFP